jgi:hypothetical protein
VDRLKMATGFPKLQLAVLALGCGLILTAPADARRKAKAEAVSFDRGYVSALAAANQFMHAWQMQDEEAGVMMMTDAAKLGVTAERLETFLSPGSDMEQSYEIGRGRKLSEGRYIFPVALFSTTSGKRAVRPRLSQIVVTGSGKNDWAVDKLP